MSYSDDFAAVDTAGAPLSPDVMVGADPMVWGAILLALAVAAMIGWLMGSGSRSRKGDAAPAIWEAIDDAARAAMQADTDALPARASDLHRVVKSRLGRTLAFGGDLGKCVKALDGAIKGEVDDPSHRGAPHEPAHGPDGKHGSGEHGHQTAPPPATSVVVSVQSPPAQDHAHPPKPGKRPMTTQERNDALRLAVVAFNDHWRHRTARENDMRAVIAELSNPGPRRPRLSHGAAHH